MVRKVLDYDTDAYYSCTINSYPAWYTVKYPYMFMSDLYIAHPKACWELYY